MCRLDASVAQWLPSFYANTYFWVMLIFFVVHEILVLL